MEADFFSYLILAQGDCQAQFFTPTALGTRRLAQKNLASITDTRRLRRRTNQAYKHEKIDRLRDLGLLPEGEADGGGEASGIVFFVVI